MALVLRAPKKGPHFRELAMCPDLHLRHRSCDDIPPFRGFEFRIGLTSRSISLMLMKISQGATEAQCQHLNPPCTKVVGPGAGATWLAKGAWVEVRFLADEQRPTARFAWL